MKKAHHPKIIVITGAESTGKSTLTQELSRFFQAPAFPEYSREYIERIKRPYTYTDVYSISLMQKAQMTIASTLKSDYVFFDTWLIITWVWFEVVYGKVPSWIYETVKNSPVDLFLLCNTDLPWVPDPVRENGGEMRDKLQLRYRQLISGLGFRIGEVSGSFDDRFNNAVEIISKS